MNAGTAADLRPGDPRRLGDYELVGRLGSGGQGTVFLATDRQGQQVAVKLLHPEALENAAARARFVREVNAARKVAQFCAAAVLHADVDGELPYIVSEYVSGPSLRSLVADRGPLTAGALDRLAIGIATALVAIHQAGIVHRDLKPGNVLMSPDGPRVIDFGIARVIDSTTVTSSRAVGSPGFIAPEALRAEDPGTPADVFAWGATVAYAATGRSPFGQDSIGAVLMRSLHEEPDLDGLTGPLRDLVVMALDKDPSRRLTAPALLLRLLGHEDPADTPLPATSTSSDMLVEGATIAAYQTPPGGTPQPGGWTHIYGATAPLPPDAAFGQGPSTAPGGRPFTAGHGGPASGPQPHAAGQGPASGAQPAPGDPHAFGTDPASGTRPYASGQNPAQGTQPYTAVQGPASGPQPYAAPGQGPATDPGVYGGGSGGQAYGSGGYAAPGQGPATDPAGQPYARGYGAAGQGPVTDPRGQYGEPAGGQAYAAFGAEGAPDTIAPGGSADPRRRGRRLRPVAAVIAAVVTTAAVAFGIMLLVNGSGHGTPRATTSAGVLNQPMGNVTGSVTPETSGGTDTTSSSPSASSSGSGVTCSNGEQPNSDGSCPTHHSCSSGWTWSSYQGTCVRDSTPTPRSTCPDGSAPNSDGTCPTSPTSTPTCETFAAGDCPGGNITVDPYTPQPQSQPTGGTTSGH